MQKLHLVVFGIIFELKAGARFSVVEMMMYSRIANCGSVDKMVCELVDGLLWIDLLVAAMSTCR